MGHCRQIPQQYAALNGRAALDLRCQHSTPGSDRRFGMKTRMKAQMNRLR
jgi:hypothetical protein